jgi:hypothetical protein
MRMPREFTLINTTTPTASFTTQFAVVNYNLGSVQFVYSSLNSESSTVNVEASNDNATWSPLEPEVTTLTSGYDSVLFRIPNIDTAFIRVAFNVGSTSQGSIAAYVVLK